MDTDAFVFDAVLFYLVIADEEAKLLTFVWDGHQLFSRS